MKSNVINLYPFAECITIRVNDWSPVFIIQADSRMEFTECEEDSDFLSEGFPTEEQAWEDAYNKYTK